MTLSLQDSTFSFHLRTYTEMVRDKSVQYNPRNAYYVKGLSVPAHAKLYILQGF